MDFFITILRALATCIITNYHYTGIYPTDIIAQMSLGMAGNFLFFAVSGYCISNVKTNFFSWYKKRVFRCYIPLFIATAFFLLIAQFYEPIQYMFSSNPSVNSFFSRHYDITVNSVNTIPLLFIYPTLFHFVSSIAILYVPYYFVVKYTKTNKQLTFVFVITVFATVLTYLFAYDKSYFHIDVPREQMIRFLFFLSMLLGLWFKRNKTLYVDKFKIRYAVGLISSILLYAGCKYYLEINDTNAKIAQFQIVYVFIVLYLVYCFFAFLSSLESTLKKIKKGRRIIEFLADSTLEIYLVQVPLIEFVRDVFSNICSSLNPSNKILSVFVKYQLFPLNWILLTFLIVVFSIALKFVSNKAMQFEAVCSEKICNFFKNQNKK